MHTTFKKLFNDKSDLYTFIANYCNLCMKKSYYNRKSSISQKFRCAIDRDIQLQLHGFLEINVRSYCIVQSKICKYIKK